MIADTWDPRTHPLWYGSAPMSNILSTVGPADMFVHGEGSWLIDQSGRRYLDARAGIANVMLGYSRRDIAEAMYQQAMSLPFACTMRYERPAPVTVKLARALVNIAPGNLARVRFTHTGSSAVEAALLMARRYHRNLGRFEKLWVVALQGSYHGSTLMSMAASGQPGLHSLFGPMPDGFHHVPPPNRRECGACLGQIGAEPTCANELVTAVAGLGRDCTAAIIVEPIKGLSGVPLPGHYLRAVRELCSANNILLIFDEVFSGFGRMGSMFASELFGVYPDIMCLSKGMTSGYAPLGAVLVTDQVYDAFNLPDQPYFVHGSSTDAHPISCAAGLATLNAYEAEDAVAHGRKMGQRVGSALVEKLAHCSVVGGVRTVGAFVAIDLIGPDGRLATMDLMRQVQAECQLRGVLIDYTPDILMVVPPLTLTQEESDSVSETVAAVLLELAKGEIDLVPRNPSVAGGSP